MSRTILLSGSVFSSHSAYQSLQSGLIGPISIDRVEKKSQCSLPDAHCFILQCLFRCKSVGKSVTSCLCMEGGSLSVLKRKLAKEDCGLGNVWDRILDCSLSDIISFPPKAGHPGSDTPSPAVNTSICPQFMLPNVETAVISTIIGKPKNCATQYNVSSNMWHTQGSLPS